MKVDIGAYTKQELMIAQAARELTDGDIVFVGIGLPSRAANLARRLHAPHVQLVYESGVYGAMPDRWPQSIGDPCLVINAIAVHSMAELFLYYLQRGLIDIGFLGAAQIDRHGNLNTTVVGSYARPLVRLPGSGGACEIALLARKVAVVLPQSRRHFPARVDFVTSPGRANTAVRRNGGVPAGPMRVITDMAVFELLPGREEMELVSLHPEVTVERLLENMGWEPRIAPQLSVTDPPTAQELELLRRLENSQ
jgi:glutaconate CoA-transferase subunit B